MTATPFAPKPHPEVRLTDRPPDREPTVERSAPAPARTVSPEERGDDAAAFVTLREAKEYERLAAADLVKMNRELEGVKKRVDEARRAYDDALRGLKEARAAFESAFSPEDTT